MSSSKIFFYENFMKFFQKQNISQNIDFEKGKHEWIPFCNTTESTMHPCVCGHNVKHITYLFNEKNENIVSVGTTCCKKYGLLEKHMKNELLIHVLREQISQHCFKSSGNLLSLENDLGELLDKYIYEKFQQITKKYTRDMDENIFYFDVFYPLNRMKDDILELKNYGYDFSKHHNEICELLREREIHNIENIEDTDSETNSEIIEKLDCIQREISQILNENLSEITDFENEYEKEVEEQEDLEENPEKEKNEQISELLKKNSTETSVFEYEETDVVCKNEYLGEKDLEENIRIEEEINKEIKYEKQAEQEKQAEEYLKNVDIEIEEAMTRYIERNINHDYRVRYTDYEPKYTERDLRLKLGIQELNIRIDNLKIGIQEYKKDFANFNENLQQFKKDIFEFNENRIVYK